MDKNEFLAAQSEPSLSNQCQDGNHAANPDDDDDLEFLSAQEGFSQEPTWETAPELSSDPAAASPFQSSCSPIARREERPKAPPVGSVRAMIQAMERRQQPGGGEPTNNPSIRSLKTVAEPQANDTNVADSTENSAAKAPAISGTLPTLTENASKNADSLPSEASAFDDNDDDDTSIATTKQPRAAKNEADDGDDRPMENEDNDDFWTSEIMEGNDADMYDEMLDDEEEGQEEKQDRDLTVDRDTSDSDTKVLELHDDASTENRKTQAIDEKVEAKNATAAPLQVTTNNIVDTTLFVPGAIVQVQARTWPGINQLGGIAKIVKTHTSTDGSVSYDLQYILDRRKEKKVDAVYVSANSDFTDDPIKGSQRRSPRSSLGPVSPPNSDNVTTSVSKPRSNLKKPPSRLKKRKSIEPVGVPKRQKSPRFVASAGLSKLTREELVEQADKLYRQRIRSAMDKGVLHICASNLSEAEERALKDLACIVKDSNVRIVQQGSIHVSKTTMCLVPINVPPTHQRSNVTPVLRTMKTMQAAVWGIPMVNTAWIFHCKRAKSLLEPDTCLFVRSLPTKRTDNLADFGVSFLAAARQASTSRARYSPFAGLGFYFCGFKQKEESNFQALLRAAGVDTIFNKQSLLSHVKEESSRKQHHGVQLLILCGDSTVFSLPKAVQESVESKHSSTVIVTSQWLVDSVSAGKVLPVGDYGPTATKARQLWESSKSKPFHIVEFE